MPAQKMNPFEAGVQVQLDMSDDGLATVNPTTGAFVDTGYMPINALTISGRTQNLPGGGMDRMFLQYTATGTMDPQTGVITYKALDYDLFAHKGQATFGRDVSGNPTASGPGAAATPLHEVLLAHGNLIQGQLMYDASGGIGGVVDVTVQVNKQTVGKLDISIQHGVGDIGYPAPGLITLTGGTLHASFIPS